MNELIKKYEGFSSTPYLCPAGVWTIGFGTTYYPDGKKVSPTDEPISRAKADAFLLHYVLNEIMPKIANLNLTDNQNKALVSLIYNIGWSAFAKSKCYKAIQKKDWETVFKNWDWVKGNGKFLLGLAKRRAEELDLFFADI